MYRLLQSLFLIVFALLSQGCSEDFGVDQHGRTVAAADLEERWLVVNYWADWCGPCRKEVAELNALAQERPDIRVLGVNYDGLQGEELRQSAATLGIAYTVLADDPAERFQLPRSDALPATYLIDARGRLREQLLGEQTAEGLTARLLQLQQAP